MPDAELIPGRDLDWHEPPRRRRNASRSRRPIRSTSSTRRAPPAAQGHRPRQRRAPGRAQLDDEEHLRRRAGRGVLGGLRRRLGGRSLVHRLRPAVHGNTTVLYEGKPVGTPDAGAFWRVISQHGSRASSRRRRRSAPSSGTIPEVLIKTLRPVELSHAFPRRRALRSDTLHVGRGQLGVPVIDHWWQTETGWPIAPTARHRAAAREAGVVPRAGAGLGRAGARRGSRRVPAGEIGSLVSSSRCRRAPADALERDERYREAPTSRLSRLLPDGRRRLQGRGRLRLRDDPHRRRDQRRRAPAPTGAMEEVLASHPDVAECAVIGVADALKGQVPLGSSCSRPARAGTRRSWRRSWSWSASGSGRSPRSRRRWS